jgi:hypothetical protein
MSALRCELEAAHSWPWVRFALTARYRWALAAQAGELLHPALHIRQRLHQERGVHAGQDGRVALRQANVHGAHPTLAVGAAAQGHAGQRKDTDRNDQRGEPGVASLGNAGHPSLGGP